MVIGIDVGGTKTEAVLFDGKGNIKKQVILPSAHPSCATDKEMMDILKKCLLDLTSSIVIGYAGYGKSQRMRMRIEKAIKETFQGRRYKLLNDIELAMWSTLGKSDGIILILGTGSVALKRKGNLLERQGGWGYLLGDEGSGYAIGREILRRFAKEADGRRQRTSVYEQVMKFYQLKNSADIIDCIMSDGVINRTAVARCAQLSEIDECKDILEKNAKEVIELVSSFKEDGLQIFVTGGMRKNQKYMQLLKQLEPCFQVSENNPVYGAYEYWHAEDF